MIFTTKKFEKKEFEDSRAKTVLVRLQKKYKTCTFEYLKY
jgi:hypothetical protein